MQEPVFRTSRILYNAALPCIRSFTCCKRSSAYLTVYIRKESCIYPNISKNGVAGCKIAGSAFGRRLGQADPGIFGGWALSGDHHKASRAMGHSPRMLGLRTGVCLGHKVDRRCGRWRRVLLADRMQVRPQRAAIVIAMAFTTRDLQRFKSSA